MPVDNVSAAVGGDPIRAFHLLGRRGKDYLLLANGILFKMDSCGFNSLVYNKMKALIAAHWRGRLQR